MDEGCPRSAFPHTSDPGVFVIADLDTLLIALYVELVDRIIPGPGTTPPRARPPAAGDRCRADLPGRGSGVVALQRRTALAAGRADPGGSPVPPPAGPKRVQRAAQSRSAAAGGDAALAGRTHPRLGRTAAVDGRHPDRLRPVQDHQPTLKSVRLGRL